MNWVIELHDAFVAEFNALSNSVRREMLAKVELLEEFGPHLGRPHADTLYGSKHANMKELRFDAGNGIWRIAFAFDPSRQAILLVAGNKSGVKEKRFYKQLIEKADSRFDDHLISLKG